MPFERQLEDAQRRDGIARVPGRVNGVNGPDGPVAGQLRLAPRQREQPPLVEIALRERHVDVIELRLVTLLDEPAGPGPELGPPVDGPLPNPGRNPARPI